MPLAGGSYGYLDAAPKIGAPDPYNTLYGLANPGTTVPATQTNPYQQVLSGAAGYGMLNPGTTTPGTTVQNKGGIHGTAAGLGPSTGGFDYTTLLNNDPILRQTLAQIKQAQAADQAALNGTEQQALIGYGQVPGSLAQIPGLASAVDQTTRDLADQNTKSGLSTYARLQEAYKQAVQGTNSSLAARGLLRSGAFGQDNAQDLLGYNQAQSTAVGQLNQYLQGVYNGYLGQQQALMQQESEAYNNALAQLIAEIQAGLIHPPGGSSSSSNSDTTAPPPAVQPPDTSSPEGTTPLPIGGGNRRGGYIGGRI